MIDLDELQRIASAATAGPWFWSEENSQGATVMGRMLTKNGETIFDFGDCTRYYPTEGTEPDAADVLFMQAANPSVILDLIGIARAAADSLPKIKEGSQAPKPDAWKYRAIGSGEWRVTLNENWARALNDPNVVPLFAGAAPASQAAAPQEPTAQQIHAAARKMCDLSAEACGVDKDDNWAIYGDAYNEEAKIVLAAAALAGAAPVEAASPWIKNTGVRPVANDVRVAVIHVDGDFGCDPADHFDWGIEDDGSDIAAYFVIPAAPAPGESQ